MEERQFHKDFRWNDHPFKEDKEILEYAKVYFPHWLEFLIDWFDKDTTVTVLTSGSTGQPKPIELRKESMIESAKATGDFFEMRSGIKALHSLPSQYIAGKMMMIRALVLGWELTEIEPKSKLSIPSQIFDFGALVPLQVAENFDELHRIKTLLVGGGAISENLAHRLRSIDSSIFATYGMTETITHVACKPISYKAGFQEDKDFYQGLPGVSFSHDKRGCLCIQAPRICEGTVITNDLVDLLSNMEFKWLGRFDNIINSGGIKLIPEQLESVLQPLIGKRFFLDALPDEKLGQQLILVIEGKEELTIKEKLRSFQKEHPDLFGKHAIPKQVWFTKQFVETGSGKIQRKATMELLGL